MSPSRGASPPRPALVAFSAAAVVLSVVFIAAGFVIGGPAGPTADPAARAASSRPARTASTPGPTAESSAGPSGSAIASARPEASATAALLGGPAVSVPGAAAGARPSGGPDTASVAFGSLVGRFWDPGSGTFRAWSDGTARDGHGPEADFWWAAQLWDLTIDEAERTGTAEARAMVDRVYDGFVARHPAFESDYNDDRGWWALAATRAYDLTHRQRYLDRARSLYAGIVASRDGALGGGIWWRRSVHDQKNVATNAPAVMTAVALCRLTLVDRYCDDARDLFGWLDRTLRDGDRILDHVETSGRRVDWAFSYNYGTFVGAADALAQADGDARYRTLAGRVGDRGLAELSSGGILRPEGTGDGGGFRGIFVRVLRRAADDLGRSDWRASIAANAAAAWQARRSDGLIADSWPKPQGGPIESLMASSGVAVLEAAATDSASRH